MKTISFSKKTDETKQNTIHRSLIWFLSVCLSGWLSLLVQLLASPFVLTLFTILLCKRQYSVIFKHPSLLFLLSSWFYLFSGKNLKIFICVLISFGTEIALNGGHFWTKYAVEKELSYFRMNIPSHMQMVKSKALSIKGRTLILVSDGSKKTWCSVKDT